MRFDEEKCRTSPELCFNIHPSIFETTLLSFSLLEARLLSHQTPVSHGGSCDPTGRSAAWNRCGRGYTPADSQSESVVDTTVEGASYISQRLGPSRSVREGRCIVGRVGCRISPPLLLRFGPFCFKFILILYALLQNCSSL